MNLTLRLKAGLFTKIREGALEKGISTTVWIKAILMDFTHIHVGLTNESGDVIRRVVRGHN
jgi:hypothetical protein